MRNQAVQKHLFAMIKWANLFTSIWHLPVNIVPYMQFCQGKFSMNETKMKYGLISSAANLRNLREEKTHFSWNNFFCLRFFATTKVLCRQMFINYQPSPPILLWSTKKRCTCGYHALMTACQKFLLLCIFVFCIPDYEHAEVQLFVLFNKSFLQLS